jgi:hypothetical protein
MVEDSILNDELTQPQTRLKNTSISLKVKLTVAAVFTISFFLYRLLYKKYIGNSCNIDKYH